MTPSRRLTATWALLLAVTLAGYGGAAEGLRLPALYALLVGLAAAKATLIVREYMEVRTLPAAWRRGFLLLVFGPAALLAVLHAVRTGPG